MAERRCVYRVYESYHDSSESGTIEYGYYSGADRAKQRALEVWKQKDYGDIDEVYPCGSICGVSNGWSSGPYIRVSEIEVDTDTQCNNVGYT